MPAIQAPNLVKLYKKTLAEKEEAQIQALAGNLAALFQPPKHSKLAVPTQQERCKSTLNLPEVDDDISTLSSFSGVDDILSISSSSKVEDEQNVLNIFLPVAMPDEQLVEITNEQLTRMFQDTKNELNKRGLVFPFAESLKTQHAKPINNNPSPTSDTTAPLYFVRES